jgi:vesicle coat complex subunit
VSDTQNKTNDFLQDAMTNKNITQTETAVEQEIERLRHDCAEAYEAVGFLVDCLGYWNMSADDPRHEQITKLLDNLFAAADGEKRPYDDLLPFGWPYDPPGIET